jgi:hypothetical protein
MYNQAQSAGNIAAQGNVAAMKERQDAIGAAANLLQQQRQQDIQSAMMTEDMVQKYISMGLQDRQYAQNNAMDYTKFLATNNISQQQLDLERQKQSDDWWKSLIGGIGGAAGGLAQMYGSMSGGSGGASGGSTGGLSGFAGQAFGGGSANGYSSPSGFGSSLGSASPFFTSGS